MKTFLKIFSLLILFCSPLYAQTATQTINLNTTYGSPSGNFDTLTLKYLELTPTTAPTCSSSTLGKQYVSIGSADSGRIAGATYCCKDPGPNWVECTGAGYWTLTGTPPRDLYPNDTYPTPTFRLGIGTTSPAAQLHLDGVASSSDGIIATGEFGTNGTLLTIGGTGTRFIWYPKKAAIRAGAIINDAGALDDTELDLWNEVNIGPYSVAMGKDTKASGTASIAAGGENNKIHSTGNYSTISGGKDNTVSGAYSTIPGGLGNSVASDYSFAGGQNMILGSSATNTFIWGKDDTSPYLTINDPNSFIIESAKVRLNPDVTSYIASPGTPSGPNLEIFSDLTDNTADILLVGNADPVGKLHFYRNTAGTLNQVSSIRSNNATGNIVFESSIAPAGDRFIFGTDAQNNAAMFLKDSSGATYDYAVTSPINTRIIRGNVTVAGGVITLQEGDITEFTAARTSLGVYTITFFPAFSVLPIVTATPISGIDRSITVTSPLPGSCIVNTFNNTPAAADSSFNFIAIGQKGAL